MGRPSRKDQPEKAVQLAERRAITAELRRQGSTWHTIAATTNVSITQARLDWAEWLDTLEPPLDREQRRADIREQYETRLALYAAEANQSRNRGDHQTIDKAETRILRVLDALRKLDGLDAPTAVDVTTGGQPLGASDERLAELAARFERFLDEPA